MPGKAEVFEKFVARDPQTLLRLLLDVNPLVTLHTCHGHAFTGQLLALEGEGAGASVLLQCAEGNGATSDDVLYLPLAHVAAVRVHDGHRWAVALSDGAVARMPGEAAPTRLELKREVARLAEEFQRESGLGVAFEVDWAAAPEGDDVSLNLRDLVRALIGSVGANTDDTVGRAAVAGLQAVAVVHKPEAALSLEVSGKRLLVEADLRKALPHPLDKAVREKFESAL